jgi:hypothetical protein
MHLHLAMGANSISRPLGGTRRIKVVALLFAAFASSSCVTHQLYYGNTLSPTGQLEEVRSVIPPGKDDLKTPLAIIEFGDQGNAKDPSQTEAAKKLIGSIPKPLLVVFVHGWHNNATTYPGRFVNLLNSLAKSAFLEKQGYQVVGVYISWHAKQYNDLLFEYGTTFWNRYETATRLGAGVDCESAISDVVATARHQNQNARTFLIGHSFGGLLLQQAVAHSVTTAKRDGTSYAPADLTLFLNPASDSEITREMIERLRTSVKAKGPGGIGPVFATLSSEADAPNKGLFSLGKSLAGISKHFDRFPVVDSKGNVTQVSGRYFFTHTPGNNPYLRSHVTSPNPEVLSMPASANAFEENLTSPVDPKVPRFKTQHEKTGQWLAWTLEPVISPATDYWIVRVDQRIMDGHNDIFNPRAVAMMAALYRLSTQRTERTGEPAQLERRVIQKSERVPLPLATEVDSYSTQLKSMSPETLKTQRNPVPAPTAATPR